MGEWRRRGKESLDDTLLNKALYAMLRVLKNVTVCFVFYFPIDNFFDNFFKSEK